MSGMLLLLDDDRITTVPLPFSTKLKLYGCLHDTVDRHNMLLNEREHVLTAAKKKLVEESGSVLGR